MEENQNQNENVEEVQETVYAEQTVEQASGGSKMNVILALLKKKMFITIVAIVIVFVIVYNVFFNSKGKAKSTIEDFCSAIGKGKLQKALKKIDPAGMYAFQGLSKDEYEDFWNEYKEFKKSDEYDEKMDDWKEIEESAKEAEEDFDKDDEIKIKVKKITKFKKLSKNLYQVKAKIKATQDDDTKTETVNFYLMKDGLGFKIVGGDMLYGVILGSGLSSLY